jgi:amino acid transporter
MSLILDIKNGVRYYRLMQRLTNPTTRASRRYTVQLTIAMLLYILLLFGSILAVQRLNVEGAWRFVLILIPLLPVAAVVPAVFRYVRDTDEFERQLTTESLAIAAGVTAVFSVTYAFLESAGLPHLSAWYTWLVVMGSWGIARVTLRWRYR